MAIISSVYTATITPYIFKHAMGGLVNFVNFLGTEDNPSGSTTNFKKIFLALNLKYFESSWDIFIE